MWEERERLATQHSYVHTYSVQRPLEGQITLRSRRPDRRHSPYSFRDSPMTTTGLFIRPPPPLPLSLVVYLFTPLLLDTIQSLTHFLNSSDLEFPSIFQLLVLSTFLLTPDSTFPKISNTFI